MLQKDFPTGHLPPPPPVYILLAHNFSLFHSHYVTLLVPAGWLDYDFVALHLTTTSRHYKLVNTHTHTHTCPAIWTRTFAGDLENCNRNRSTLCAFAFKLTILVAHLNVNRAEMRTPCLHTLLGMFSRNYLASFEKKGKGRIGGSFPKPITMLAVASIVEW